MDAACARVQTFGPVMPTLTRNARALVAAHLVPRVARADESTGCVYARLATDTFGALVDVDTGDVVSWVQRVAIVTEAACCAATIGVSVDGAAVVAAFGATGERGAGLRMTAACGSVNSNPAARLPTACVSAKCYW